MYLRNFDDALLYFNIYSREEVESEEIFKINGWYKFIVKKLSALFFKDGCLFMIFEDKEIKITDNSQVKIEEIDTYSSKFYFIQNGNVVIEFTYYIEQLGNLEQSPFWNIDENDFKWGNFISEIINDKETKMNFISNLMEQFE